MLGAVQGSLLVLYLGIAPGGTQGPNMVLRILTEHMQVSTFILVLLASQLFTFMIFVST